MPKGIAICKCLSCGKEFSVSEYKISRREADEFVIWAEANVKECKECEAKRIAAERAAESQKAAEAAREKGWPELTGSEKQIAWAAKIREREIEKLMPERREKRGVPNAIERFDTCLSVLLSNTSAAWWIDHRDMIWHEFHELIIRCTGSMRPVEKSAEEKRAEEDAKEDTATIAVPVERSHDGVADITVTEQAVSVQYRKDDAFRDLVKAIGYRWDRDCGCWALTIGPKTGSPEERAAELGSKLLNGGFAIRIQNSETLRSAVEGNYEPMTYRWVSAIDASKFFVISWGRDDDLYSTVKKLPGARYVSPNIQVPAASYMEVLDLAETYGFKFTPGAQRLIEEVGGKKQIVSPAAAKDPDYVEKPLGQILESSRDVLDDLRDDP